MFSFPIVLLAILEPYPPEGLDYSPQWAAAFGTYQTVEECESQMTIAYAEYSAEWPNAIFWCANPVMIPTEEGRR